MNLHEIVRGAINTNLQDQEFDFYRSVGQVNDGGGLLIASYEKPIKIKGNFQSENDAALNHANLAGQNSVIRKLYLYSPYEPRNKPYSINRTFARSGDYLVDDLNQFWLITAVIEDFSWAGWECVRCTLQQNNPELNIEDNETEEPDENEKLP